MQFLHERQRAEDAAAPCAEQGSEKAPLEGWSLGYALEPELPSEPHEEAAEGCGARPWPRGRGWETGVARELYSCPAPEPRALLRRCGLSADVADALELLQVLRAQPGRPREERLWLSPKLDRKLRHQLEDPLSVVSGALPCWATALPRLYPFLFSLDTRKMFLRYTAFGPSFAVHWAQESKLGSFLRRRAMVPTELSSQTDPQKIEQLLQEVSNIEDHVVKSNFWLGALQSTLVRMQKGEELLKQSEMAMELVATSSRLLEVQFESETGFGSAVTQSFYVEVARALQGREANRLTPLWVEDDGLPEAPLLAPRQGLRPRPLEPGPRREAACRRFRFLGRLMGQALREGFIVPLPLAEDFFRLAQGEALGPQSLPRPGEGCAGELCGLLAEAAAALARGASAEGLPGLGGLALGDFLRASGACFLETGLAGAALCPGGEELAVTPERLPEFVQLATRFWFGSGVRQQLEAFRAGLDDVLPFACLSSFSSAELREMFCGEDRIEWNEQALLGHLHPLGGLTDASPAYRHLVAVLLEMDQVDRSRFLDFVSSCPRLPPGGISAFHVDVFPDAALGRSFPRSRACARQLYLPPYSSMDELREKLHEAMHCSVGHYEQQAREA